MKRIRCMVLMSLATILFTSCVLIHLLQPYDGTKIATFSVAPGYYPGTIELTFKSRTDNATIVYTADGTNPSTQHGTVFDGDAITIDKDMVVKAVAYLGSDVSYMNVGRYHIGGSPVLYTLGDTGPAGGVISYDKGDYGGGWRYMEAVPSTDIQEGDRWGYCPPNTAYEIGTGWDNTIKLLDYNGPDAEAAKYCWDLAYGEYEDWFLPSVYELETILEYLGTLGTAYDGEYWCSTDSSDSLDWAFDVQLHEGLVHSSFIDIDSNRFHPMTLPVRRL
jgi:hypothetical protein